MIDVHKNVNSRYMLTLNDGKLLHWMDWCKQKNTLRVNC
jgi:hypothetical protein